jgi:hypothetical protein
MGVKKPILWATTAVVALFVLAGLLLSFRQRARGESTPPVAAAEAAAEAARRHAPGASTANAGAGEDSIDGVKDTRELIAYLQQRFGPKLKSPYIQLRMLEKLIRYYRTHSPDRWEQAVLDVLRAAFPELYEELAANLKRWVEYERWMKANQGDLQKLGDEDRRANIWQERNRLFGKELAEQIWASELKNQAVASSLAAIDARSNATISEKLTLYKESLGETYGDKSEVFLERHRHEAMMRFVELQSVQQQLSAMAPEQRSQNLREIRTGMGLDEEALQRWDALDRERDARWAAGAKYMEEREALAKKYSGTALEEQLKPLRERYFGAEAQTIANEEQAGFFRFSRPRVWGRD